MTTALAIRTIIELVISVLVVYGVFHENKFIALENKIIIAIAKKIYIRRHRKEIVKRKSAKQAQNVCRKNKPCSNSQRKVYDVLNAA